MEHDELIDRALASYSTAELSAGFRGRVLNKIGVRQHRVWWFAWPLGAAVAACAVWLFQAPPPERPINPLAAYVPETILKAYDPPSVVHQRHLPRVHAPLKLTEEERILASWVGDSPETAASEWASLRVRTEAPIEIKVLEIQPIATEEQSQ